MAENCAMNVGSIVSGMFACSKGPVQPASVFGVQLMLLLAGKATLGGVLPSQKRRAIVASENALLDEQLSATLLDNTISVAGPVVEPITFRAPPPIAGDNMHS